MIRDNNEEEIFFFFNNKLQSMTEAADTRRTWTIFGIFFLTWQIFVVNWKLIFVIKLFSNGSFLVFIDFFFNLYFFFLFFCYSTWRTNETPSAACTFCCFNLPTIYFIFKLTLRIYNFFFVCFEVRNIFFVFFYQVFFLLFFLITTELVLEHKDGHCHWFLLLHLSSSIFNF